MEACGRGMAGLRPGSVVCRQSQHHERRHLVLARLPCVDPSAKVRKELFHSELVGKTQIKVRVEGIESALAVRAW